MKVDNYPHITSRVDIAGGAPVVKGGRTTVRAIACYYQMGMSVDEILQSLPHLSAAKVHAALTYYFDHKNEVDRDIARQADIAFWKKQVKPRTKKAA